MSLFHLSKLQSVTSKIQGLREAFGRRPARRTAARKPRRLTIDPLEERQLLSVSVLDLDDMVANQTLSSTQNTTEVYDYEYFEPGATQSVVVDNDGDFVVSWTRYDDVLDINGTPVIDMTTGLTMTDANIFARYYTDEIQRITLPDGVIADNGNPQSGRFSMTYGGNEIQKIEITATIEPLAATGLYGIGGGFLGIGQSYIAGSINFGFDVDGNGSVSAMEKVTVVFDESLPLSETQNTLQTALQGLGGALTDATITALNTHEFLVNFGDLSNGENQPELIVSGASFVTGFLPAVMISTVREPITITTLDYYTGLEGIPVSPDNPAQTANSIEYAFMSTMEDYYSGPIEFDPQEPFRFGQPASELPYSRQAAPKVSVTAVSATVFDITFVDESGSRNHPELVMNSVFDEYNVELAPAADPVRTLKESSPEFRVNSEEPDNPATPYPEFQNQTNSALAIDADGEFVITWQADVPASVNPDGNTDIFARRFTPVASVDDLDDVSFVSVGGEKIRSVAPLGGQFQVNSFTVNKQQQPSVGMDDDGNFLIAWSTRGQDISFFNSIMAQRYNREGERVGNEYQVNNEDTHIHVDPFVAMSEDGHSIIVWSRVVDEGIVTGDGWFTFVYGEVYAPDGTVLLPAQSFLGGGLPSADFDADNNFVVAYEASFDLDTMMTSVGVRGTTYHLYDANGARIRDTSGAIITSAPLLETRPEFRINNATLDPVPGVNEPYWPYHQENVHANMDADGDLFFSYEGYGPDVADNTYLEMEWLKDQISVDKNPDLLPYLPMFLSTWGMAWSGDVDSTVDDILIDAMNDGATDEQLGRLRAIVDKVIGKFRGEPNGIMYTTMDAHPNLGTDNILYSDSVTNSMRDGSNARFFVVFDSMTGGGNFRVRLTNGLTGQTQETPNIAWPTNNTINGLAGGLESTLTAMLITGDAWRPEPPLEGPVEVRYVSPFEVQERIGTPWEIDYPWSSLPSYVYEVTFQGSVHDIPMDLTFSNYALTRAGANEVQLLTFHGYPPNLGPGPGYFSLQVGGLTTNPIFFDPDKLDVTALNIQNALDAIYPGTTVTVVPGGPPYEFQVIFGGASGGVNQPTIMEDVIDGIDDGYLQTTTLVNGGPGTPNIPLSIMTTAGDMGTRQMSPAMAVEPDGDFVIAWTEHAQSTPGVVTNSNIHVRRFNEDTDTAGPLITDFTLPSGERLVNGGQMLDTLNAIVVSFDERMKADGPDSVTDPNNWALLRDGAEVLNGISDVFFGMNMAAELSDEYDLNPIGKNKWEAVVVFDGNGSSDGKPALGDGHYEIVAKNVLRDNSQIGNPLRRTGYDADGLVYSRDFEIAGTSGVETRVHQRVSGDQYLLEPSDEAVGQPSSPRSVATNAEGDYVTVWVDNKQGAEGVYAKLYDVSFADGPAGRKTYTTERIVAKPGGGTWLNNEIRVTDNPTATFASVARDADGDFIVTWSQEDTTPGGTSWDVYIQRYDAVGNPIGDELRVNAETDDIQRFSSVGMDADGDFVVAWQSQGQDGSGYGVYAQRYSPAGNPIGGTNEVQVLSFGGQPKGTFTLAWEGNITQPIEFHGNTFGAVEAIETALLDIGAQVEVAATNLTDVVIRFVGLQGSGDQTQITVNSVDMVSEGTAEIVAATRIDGATGEFRVNDTTENNQRFPSVSVGVSGDIVVSWTSSGQNGDAAYETNVYAKQLERNEIIRGSSNMDTYRADTWTPPIPGMERSTFIVSSDDPGFHVTPVGGGFDGVGMVNIVTALGTGIGSGSLLTTGMHMLTAAHVVTDAMGNPYSPGAVSVTFNLPSGDVTIDASQIFVHPNYNGNPFLGSDVAVIALETPAPGTVERYDIFRSSTDLSQGFVGSRYGYGMSGTGDIGSVLPTGVKRSGENRWEALGGLLGVSNDLLIYDFDNGLPANDAFGALYGMSDTGLGDAEVIGAPGDSGGPTFVGGLIASVLTGGISVPGPHDYIPGIQSSWGDFGADTAVAPFASWIDGITLGSSAEILVNQTISADQKWSSVAVDADGDFVVTWTSYGHDGVGSGPGAGLNGQEGVYARRFTYQGNARGGEFLVNSFGDAEQQHSQVDIDADGDFIVTWESFQERPAPPYSGPYVDPDEPNSYGIFAQRYANELAMALGPYLGPNGEIGGELHVNNTELNNQRFPSIALSDTGDAVLVWSGYGDSVDAVDDQGIFFRRIPKREDNAGPFVADVVNAVADEDNGGFVLGQVLEGTVLAPDVEQFMVTFSEEMFTNPLNVFALNNLTNLNNWELSKDGLRLANGVKTIEFGLSQGYHNDPRLTTTESNKYVAVITFDVDPITDGSQPLNQGDYVLSVSDATEDLFGNALDGNMDGTPGGRFDRKFTVLAGASDTPGVVEPDPGEDDPVIHENIFGNQDQPAVSTDAQGNFVAVWVDYGRAGDGIDEGSVMFRRFNAVGDSLGASQIVNSYLPGTQTEPDVATDLFGNFVVVWSGQGGIDSTGYADDAGIFARVYDAFGVPQGEQFRVNQHRQDIQMTPRVDLGPNGDFVVTWNGAGAGDVDHNVYARKYNLASGLPITDDIRVNEFTDNRQETADVALDDDGRFAVVWASDGQDGNQWGIYGRNFNADGTPIADREYRVNAETYNKQIDPQVAMDADGDYVVSWSSFDQDNVGYGIYARRFSIDQGAKSDEFLVNQETMYWQHQSAIAMDSDGDFVVSWSTFGQDNEDAEDYGVYARLYNADGSDFMDQSTETPVGELRINGMFRGDQVHPAVAMDNDGDFVVAWVGPEEFPDITGTTNVFARTIGVTQGGSADIQINQGGGWGGSSSWGATQSEVLRGSTTLLLSGSDDQADTFEFIAASSPGDWTVLVNGEPMYVSPDTEGVYFNGAGQNDTVIFTGSNGADRFDWDDGTARFSGNGFRVEAHNVENVTVHGGNGPDRAYLNDSDAADQFAAAPGTATLNGGLYSVQIDGFAQINAFAGNGGVDQATFTGSAGDETFFADSASAEMYGDGFRLQAKGFETVLAAGAGGNDQAFLGDSQANDVFLGQADESRFYSEDVAFDLTVSGFNRVVARSANGGQDRAELSDTAGNDVFLGKVHAAAMFDLETGGAAYRVDALRFSEVSALATTDAGEGDIAKLYGVDAPTVWEADYVDGDTWSSMSSEDGLLYTALAFDQVEGHGVAGADNTLKKGDTSISGQAFDFVIEFGDWDEI